MNKKRMIPEYAKKVECIDCHRWGGRNHAHLTYSEHEASGYRCTSCLDEFQARQQTRRDRAAQPEPATAQEKIAHLKQLTEQSIHNFYRLLPQESPFHLAFRQGMNCGKNL
jgi:hypothetical protein